MSDVEILRQKDPNLADLIDQWRAKFQGRPFDLTKEADRADFYEGIMEMTRHIASGSASGMLHLTVCNDGVTGLSVSSVPTSCASSSD